MLVANSNYTYFNIQLQAVPEIDFSEICYSLFSNRHNALPAETENLLKQDTYEGEDSLPVPNESSLGNPGGILPKLTYF